MPFGGLWGRSRSRTGISSGAPIAFRFRILAIIPLYYPAIKKGLLIPVLLGFYLSLGGPLPSFRLSAKYLECGLVLGSYGLMRFYSGRSSSQFSGLS